MKSKGGQEKIIKTPEEMEQLFYEYREDVKNHPREKEVFGGKDFEKRIECLERPLTLVGFYNWCRKNASDVHNYFENTEERYNEFKGICRAIKEEIRQDQIEGGMVGQYNASITQRLNGLVDKKEHDHSTQGKPMFGDNPLNK